MSGKTRLRRLDLDLSTKASCFEFVAFPFLLLQNFDQEHNQTLSFHNQQLGVVNKMTAVQCLEDLIPDELILVCLSFLQAKDVLTFQETCRRYQNLNAEDHWRALCERRWQDWPIYLADDRLRRDPSEVVEGSPASTWKDRYKWVECDFRRTEITQEELETLEWHFNFLPWAGGNSNGTGTRSPAYFHRNCLYLVNYLWIYPSLNFEVLTYDTDNLSVDDIFFRAGLEVVLGEPLRQAIIFAGTSNPRHSTTQYVQVSLFPPHYIARTSEGGWVLWNENVVFCSAGITREARLPDLLASDLLLHSG